MEDVVKIIACAILVLGALTGCFVIIWKTIHSDKKKEHYFDDKGAQEDKRRK